MNMRTWATTAVVLCVCGGVGWLAGRGGLAVCGQHCAPLAAIQPAVEIKSISDEEAKERVLQLIQAESLDAGPKIEAARQITMDDGAEPPLAQPLIQETELASPTVLPEPKRHNAERFDIWMLLFVPSPIILDEPEDDELKDFFKVESDSRDMLVLRSGSAPPEPKSPRRTPERRMLRDCEECPHHPEIDTLEYRPTDAKKGEYEKFQRKVW